MSDSDCDPELAVAIAASLETYNSDMSTVEPSRDEALRSEILTSITKGNFTDTRFYLPSRRHRLGLVTGFRPVYANGAILSKEVEDIGQMLQGGFSESLLATFNNEDELTSGYGVPLHDYGYDSDSDLEDDEDDALPPEKSVEARSEVSELHAEHNSTEAVDASSSTGQVHGRETYTVSPLTTEQRHMSSSPSAFGSMGRTVIVKGTAYKTWVALVAYLYTGQITFAPLRSASQSPDDAESSHLEDPRPNSCSPKSMYRLADKYGLHKLKELALSNLRTELGSDNIVQELTSSFTSCYPEILALQLEFLCNRKRILDVVDSESFRIWIARVAQGELPHSEHVVLALFQSMARRIPEE